MKKLVILTLFLISIITTVPAQGFLKASDKKIINDKGENVLLRGMGLGGWMLQEGYMLKLQGANPQYSIRKRIQQLLGAKETQAFYDSWISNFITKADIDSMHKWGFNSVRLPMHYNLYTLPVEQEPDSTKQTWIAKGFQLTDSLLSWCKANNMYLILDLHAAPGGQGNDLNIADRDSTKPALWQSPANQEKTIALWKQLAGRYKDEPYVGAYDVLNEPNWGFEDPINDLHGNKETSNKPLRDLYMRITQAIRSVDKKHIIIIEGNAWGNNYKGIFPLWDDNMALSFHKYWNSNNIKAIQSMLDTRTEQNVPIWLGETGENSNTWFTDAVHLFEENNIGWSWWPLKKLGSNNPLVIKSNPNYDSLVDFWNGRTKIAPKQTDAYNGLMDLAKSSNIHSNIIKYDVIDALFRQPFSNAAKPFKNVVISGKESVIQAADYDFGRNGFAYYDKDTGNYSQQGGRRNVGNKGHAYRNDGVDIYWTSEKDENYYIGSIEDGEWLQYTISVKEKGTYLVALSVTANTDSSAVAIVLDDKKVVENMHITATSDRKNWQTQPAGKLELDKGTHVIRIFANKGGFNFKELLLTKQ